MLKNLLTHAVFSSRSNWLIVALFREFLLIFLRFLELLLHLLHLLVHLHGHLHKRRKEEKSNIDIKKRNGVKKEFGKRFLNITVCWFPLAKRFVENGLE